MKWDNEKINSAVKTYQQASVPVANESSLEKLRRENDRDDSFQFLLKIFEPIIKSHIPNTDSSVSSISGTFEDLYQAGATALFNALQNFDRNKVSKNGSHVRFITYAYPYIVGGIYRELNGAGVKTLRIPISSVSKLNTLYSTYLDLTNSAISPQSATQQLADKYNLNLVDVLSMLQTLNGTEDVDDFEGQPIQPNEKNLDEEEPEIVHLIKIILRKVSVRQQKIVNDIIFKGYSFSETGRDLHLSTSIVKSEYLPVKALIKSRLVQLNPEYAHLEEL